jgi:hypothetical protein
VSLERALAGARSGPVLTATRTALVAGNVGKLGQELLNVLLEGPEYAQVAVAVRRPMRTVMPRLLPIPMPAERAAWNPAGVLGRAPDDLYLCLEPARVSFWKLAQLYVALTSEEIVAIARRMRAAGTRRLAVVTPLEALQQLGLDAVIRNTDEMELVGAGFDRLVILRPSAEEQAAAAAGVFDSVARGVLRTLGSIMTPRRLQPVRVRSAARAAVHALATLQDGVHVIGAGRLREIAGDPLEG